MATRLDLCNAVLRKFGIPGAGQSNSPEDVEAVNTVIDGAVAELTIKRVFPQEGTLDAGTKGDLLSGQISSAYLDPLAAFISKFCADDFGQPIGDSEARASLGETRLRAMQYEGQTDDPIRFLSY